MGLAVVQPLGREDSVMVSLLQDPANPQKLAVTVTVAFYIDKILMETLSDEVEATIREQARKDLLKNRQVKKAIAAAAQKKLLELLGVPEPESGEPNIDPESPEYKIRNGRNPQFSK